MGGFPSSSTISVALILLIAEFAMSGTPPVEKGEEEACYQVVPYTPTTIFPMFSQQARNFDFAGKKWVVRQSWEEIGVASVVWEPAILLAQHIVEVGATLFSGARVIELGAGTGLVGMVASTLGASCVVLTDKDTRPAETNLEQNRHNTEESNVSVSVLEWGSSVLNFDPPYDVILAADVIYIEETFPHLIKTLEDLSTPESVIFLSCKHRYERDERFFELLLNSGKFEDEIVRVWPGREEVKVHKLRKINTHHY